MPMDKEKDTERAIENMRKLSKVAESCDVTLGMEVLNRYEGYIFASLSRSSSVMSGSRSLQTLISEPMVPPVITLGFEKVCEFVSLEDNKMAFMKSGNLIIELIQHKTWIHKNPAFIKTVRRPSTDNIFSSVNLCHNVW